MRASIPVLFSTLVLAAAPVAAAQAPAKSPVELDAWSEPIVWRTAEGLYSAPKHATLLPDGRVLLVGNARDTLEFDDATFEQPNVFAITPTRWWQTPPAEVVSADMSVPVDADELYVPPWYVQDDLFCGGHALTADGDLFVAGGTRYWLDVTTGDFVVVGMGYAMNYDGATWERVPADMPGLANLEFPARWYGSVTRLADGRMLVMGGYDLVYPLGLPNLSADVFDPLSGAWQVASPHPSLPFEVWNPDYTHAVVLPAGAPAEVLAFGQPGVPVLLSLSGATVWNVRPSMRPGNLPGENPNGGASSLALPLRVDEGEWGYRNGSVLMAGGAHGTSNMTHADVFDPVADAWTPRIDTGTPRHHPATVLLPDARVLLVAGHNVVGNQATQVAQFIDPARGFGVLSGARSSGIVRGYHTVALLLPDGRVLVGGGRGDDTAATGEKAHFQYYYPAYMFRPRPTIVSAPSEIDYGAPIGIATLAGEPSEVALVALGSMTHSMDFNQRHVELEILASVTTPTGQFTSAAAPADARTAPPGYYMLFVLDERRTPSEARIVHLD